MSAVLKAAHSYVDRLDWAVLPCSGKAPAQPAKAGGHGYLSATRNHDEIDRTWRFYAADSVGIACKPSGFFAVDIDPRDGGDDTWRDIIAAHEDIPPTVQQITGSGGAHILFRAPAGFEPVGSLGPGIQIKHAGYVIAAPSPHEKTRRPYAWDVDHHPLEHPIADPPAWLYELCHRPKTGAATDWAAVAIADVHVGDRTNTLTRLAGLLFRRYVDPAVAFTLLSAWNLTYCSPPLPLHKVETTVAGILERELKRRNGDGW